jgi:hypothetical protein
MRKILLAIAVFTLFANSVWAAERPSFSQELRASLLALEAEKKAPAPPRMSILRVQSNRGEMNGGTGSQRMIPPPPVARSAPINDAERQSLGCLIAGTAGLGVALTADGVNIINVIAGGVVNPANQLVLYTSLVGVVFASFCAVGQALTPAALMFYERYISPEVESPPPPPSLRTKFSPYRQSI